MVQFSYTKSVYTLDDGGLMKENQVEKAYQLISDMIFKYQLPPGSFVSDYTLSKILGMSRTPVRQAIMLLLNDGLVLATGKGFKVPEITLESIDALYDARQCLECSILRFSLQKGIEPASLALLRKEVALEQQCNQDGNIIETLSHDLEFHRILNSLCRNQNLENAFNKLVPQMMMLNVFSLASPNLDTPRVYSEICDAIENGDTDAACSKLAASIESGRVQKKNAIKKFGSYGMEGIYNFIAHSFLASLKK